MIKIGLLCNPAELLHCFCLPISHLAEYFLSYFWNNLSESVADCQICYFILVWILELCGMSYGKHLIHLKITYSDSRTITKLPNVCNMSKWYLPYVRNCSQSERNWSCSSKSNPPEVFCKKGALENFAKFTRKHLYLSPPF